MRFSGNLNKPQRAIALMAGHAGIALFFVAITKELLIVGNFGMAALGAGEVGLAGLGMLNAYIALSHADAGEGESPEYRKWEKATRDGMVIAHPALVAGMQALDGRLPPDAVIITSERHLGFMATWYARALSSPTSRSRADTALRSGCNCRCSN